MSDFAEVCIATYEQEQERERTNRQGRARKEATGAFEVFSQEVGVSDDGQTVTIGDIIFMADHGEGGAVHFRLPWTCPKCDSWHTYHVASRSDVGRVLSMTGCSDCGG